MTDLADRPLIVFPMAGLSSRFQRAGYHEPKYMLPAHGQPVFDHVVQGFRHYFDTHRFLFVCRDVAETPGFIRSRLKVLGLGQDRYIIHILEKPTEGQAETVALGLDGARIGPHVCLTIFNIDTIHHDFRFPPAHIMAADGYLEVFQGEGEHWSFVRPGADARIFEVTEKVRISDLCSSGLYHFKEAQLFQRAYSEQSAKPVEQLMGSERYIAPLYNTLIAQGHDIRFHRIGRPCLTFCGVPGEYQSFLEMDWPI